MNGETLIVADDFWRDLDPGIKGDDTVLIGKQRVHIKFENFTKMHHKLRQLDQRHIEVFKVDRRDVAVTFQKVINTCAFNKFAGELHV